MKKNKMGFVFIETIVVVAVLITSLLYLYRTYVSLSNGERTRLFYDDVGYLYRTFYVKKYFVSQRLDRISSHLSDEESSDNVNYLISFGCGSGDVFDDYDKEDGFCELMSQELHISNIYLTYYDLSKLQQCKNHEGLCSVFSRVNSSLGSYLRSVGGSGISGYRLIVEYKEDGYGNACSDEEHCRYYYASVLVEEDL